ncbi:hypothetical protein WJ47_05900 [Burkholderia ubonensis]|uniref:Uncharacterized protein n=1 Tax=Burkholderia ubonensis TaxID=101571 RepID=A0AB73GD48_9BURK|nr:hypothetical protein [Burkholderia ubonensis]KVK86427.1 hypothetical protein WJ44_35350 [Burkholderia ubonensis]KVL71172.1 hypothetical protein WJ47_05900 [Burkholderia ubonensis]KVM35853.1 hypothetical protein WJ54_34410 [Burkholderia ubonensis]KVM39925.1 hypothetical protein WJ53_00675 [Burkholderia ubonensis]
MGNPVIEQILALLRVHFPQANVAFTPDGCGGGTVIVEPVDLGAQYVPSLTWMGAQLTSGLPFADIYPVFIGGDVVRADAQPHPAPITGPHTFGGRAALQVSRRTNSLQATAEAAALKFVKVLHHVKELAR